MHLFETEATETQTTDEGVVRDPTLLEAGTDFLFFKNSKVASLTLEKDTIFQGRLYKAGTKLSFHSNGNLESGFLARNELISTRSGLLEFPKDKKITFHRNGVLARGENIKDTSLLHPYLLKISRTIAYFYPSGGLFDFHASQIESIQVYGKQVNLKPNGHIRLFDFDTFGQVSLNRASFTIDISFDDFQTDKRDAVEFHAGRSVQKPGPIRSFTSAVDSLTQGFLVSGGRFVSLYPSGRLDVFTVGADSEHFGFELTKGETIGLFESGKIRFWQVSKEVEISGKQYPANTMIFFHPNGSVAI